MHRLPLIPLTLLAAALGTGQAIAAPAPPEAPRDAAATFLIVNPAGRGNQGMAEGFLSDFAAALSASWPADVATASFSGRYHVTEVDALASIRRQVPTFALVSPGFYLTHRDDLHLVPLLAPIRAHDGPSVVHVVVAGEAARDPAAMRLGGQLAGEPAWVAGPVLRLRSDSRPTFVPIERTLEGVRRLRAAEIDGLLLHDAEWALLRATGKANGLRVAATSAELPEGPVVSFGPPDARVRAAMRSLQSFPSTPAGAKVLERMTLRGFREAAASDYAPLFPSFDAARQETQP